MKPKQSRYRHRFTHFTDALIPVYNRLFEVLAGRRHEAFRRHVLELAALEGGECLLDAGCGTGMMALRIAARYPSCTVHGIDISPKMIAVARRDAETQGLALAKGEYTLYPSHLTEAGLAITHEELGVFAWGKKVFYRVAVKQAHSP